VVDRVVGSKAAPNGLEMATMPTCFSRSAL
jgi:hypothetical protein